MSLMVYIKGNLMHVLLLWWSFRYPCVDYSTYHIRVKVQFRGPKLYEKKGTLFQEESYLPRIFRSSSLNLHTVHVINIVFWWRIFFRKHGKSTPNDRQDHHVLVADVVIMTSQCRCTRALSQLHVANHDNHVPVTPLIGSGLAVMSMQWLSFGKIM